MRLQTTALGISDTSRYGMNVVTTNCNRICCPPACLLLKSYDLYEVRSSDKYLYVHFIMFNKILAIIFMRLAVSMNSLNLVRAFGTFLGECKCKRVSPCNANHIFYILSFRTHNNNFFFCVFRLSGVRVAVAHRLRHCGQIYLIMSYILVYVLCHMKNEDSCILMNCVRFIRTPDRKPN